MEQRSWRDAPEPRGGGMGLAIPTMTPAVKVILIANVAVYLVLFLLREGSGAHRVVLDLFALSPGVWRDWFPFLPLWQLVTYGFMHGGPTHVLFNMLGVYFLGTMLEGVIGTRRFVTFYLAAVVVAGFFQLMVGMLDETSILGASGAVLAIVCAMATMRPSTMIIFFIVPMTLKTFALIYVAMDLLGLVSQYRYGLQGVAHVAHLTGAALGFAAVRTGWIWRDPVAVLSAARARRAGESEVQSRERLDSLLAKIAREGIGSLTTRERAFLKRMSKRR